MMSERMPGTLQDALNQLIAERGGLEAFDVKAMLAARGLVRLMATINAGDASLSPSGSDSSVMELASAPRRSPAPMALPCYAPTRRTRPRDYLIARLFSYPLPLNPWA
jgi:hypothetical protein